MEIEVGKLIKRAKVRKCGDGKYPVLSMTMHEGLMFQDDRFKKQIASVDQSSYQVVSRHQLVESFPIDEGVLAVQELTDEGIVSPAYKIWDVDTNHVIPKYLEYALRSPRSIEYYKSKLRGTTARRRSIPDAEFLSMMIKFPQIEEQSNIVDSIEKVKSVIALRQLELEKLNDLISARFVELFGDTDSNPMGWTSFSLDDCFEITSSKRILKSEWKEAGIPFLRVRDMVQLATTGKMDNEFYVSEEFYSTLKDSDGVPKEGDILVSATSTLGKCHIVEVGERFYFKDADVLRFRSKMKINPVFFVEQMKTQYIEGQIARTLGVTTVAHFTIKAAKTINMRLPDIELQNQFADFVKQVDKSKVAVQKLLDETQLLFDSLMQEYFG